MPTVHQTPADVQHQPELDIADTFEIDPDWDCYPDEDPALPDAAYFEPDISFAFEPTAPDTRSKTMSRSLAYFRRLADHPDVASADRKAKAHALADSPKDPTVRYPIAYGSLLSMYRFLRADHVSLIDCHRAALDRLDAAERLLEAHGIEEESPL